MGETSRTARMRGREHLMDLRERKESSVLWKHCMKEHNKEEQKFKMNVTGIYEKAMERQIAEAINIRNYNGRKKLMNSKNEWNKTMVPLLSIQM